MKNIRYLCILLAGLVLTGIALAQTTSTAPAKADVKAEKIVPQSVIKELAGYLGKPAGTTREEMIKNFVIQAKKGLTRANEIELQYAGAKNIDKVWMIILQSNVILEQVDKTPGKTNYARQAKEIATKIVNSKVPAQQKLLADNVLAMQKLKKIELPAGKEKEIRTFLAKYNKPPHASMAYVYATMLAKENQMDEFASTLADEMEKKFPKDGVIQNFLEKYMGRSAFYGKEFNAELTRLDGSKLILPKDLKGKVIVIDFWAQWCGPCRAFMPHLKEIYAKYKSKGVEIIGINLDDKREDFIDYVKTAGLDWIITFEGKGQADPTANKYKISQLPTIWVVGKDGKVFSTDAHGDLEETIKRALKVTVK